MPDNYCENGHWRYWYLASPHMKDICKSLNDLHDKYDGDIQVEKMVMNHQNYIVLYRYWDHPNGWPSDHKMLDEYSDEDKERRMIPSALVFPFEPKEGGKLYS